MGFERGPVQQYEVVWTSGHVEVIQAHQVSYQGGVGYFGGSDPEVVQFHGEFDGHWVLILRALGSELRTVRNLTQTERDEAAS